MSALGARRLRSMAETDAMPAGLRACVHEFGYPIVHACIDAGVREPARIRQLVHEIWMGARDLPNNNKTPGGGGGKFVNRLDWLLLQAGVTVSARTLLRFLRQGNYYLIPTEPSPQAIAASMDAVNHMGVVSKATKHRNRLRAALAAEARHLWPFLFNDTPEAPDGE